MRENTYFTHERIQRDLDCWRARQIAKAMLDAGLISAPEFDRLSAINLETFPPLFVEIYPKTLDMATLQSDV